MEQASEQPCDLRDLRAVREKANRAPLYVPTRELDFTLLFEPVLFDPYCMARTNYLKESGFYTCKSEEERRAVLDIARQRMENCNIAGYVASVRM